MSPLAPWKMMRCPERLYLGGGRMGRGQLCLFVSVGQQGAPWEMMRCLERLHLVRAGRGQLCAAGSGLLA